MHNSSKGMLFNSYALYAFLMVAADTGYRISLVVVLLCVRSLLFNPLSCKITCDTIFVFYADEKLLQFINAVKLNQ